MASTQIKVRVRTWRVKAAMVRVWILRVMLRRRVHVELVEGETRMSRGVLTITPRLSVRTDWTSV